MSDGRWQPFLLLPSARGSLDRRGEVESAFFLRYKVVEVLNWDTPDDRQIVVQEWPLKVVVSNFVWAAVFYHLAQVKHPKHTIGADMRRWIASTVDLADRIPYGGEMRDLMKTAASALKENVEWKHKYFKNPPTEVGTKRDTDHRCSMNLWALDRLFRATNNAEAEKSAGEALKLPLTTIWATFFKDYASLPSTPAFADYEQALRRIKRIQDDLKPDVGPALMATLLRDQSTHGHFVPDVDPEAVP